MRRLEKAVLMALIASLVIAGGQTSAWAQVTPYAEQTNPEQDLYNIFDLFLIRPAVTIAGVCGVGLVILSLPFTLPTNSVDKATDMFVVKPFKFAFDREFPDTEGMR
jgi:hypothetical protein